MPLVSITRLRVRSWRFLPQFLVYALRSARQAGRAPGNRAARLLRDRNRVFWTATLWDSESDLRRFMISGAHGRAMRKLLHWCDEAALVHWTQNHDALPSWHEAHTRLQNEGRPSKVNHPSPVHLAHRLPEPAFSSSAETRIR